jgi:Holliday junction resolvasome RuvABC endonuclease subunit
MVLSLDVGFKSTGWTVWKQGEPYDCGVIITEKSQKKSTRTADDHSARAAKMAGDILSICTKYDVQAVVGELPSGGAQSYKAGVMMGMATAVVSSVFEILEIPCEWTTPNEVKIAMTGYRSATKDEMMEAALEKFGGTIRPSGRSRKYEFCGKEFPAGMFEHIADSIGAYLALQSGNLIKMFGKKVA